MSRSMAGRRRPLPLASRVASAGLLLAAIAFTGCTSATGSSQPAAATPTPTQPQAATATPAPTPTAAALQPPAAPTNLQAEAHDADDPDAMYFVIDFSWTVPPGSISGYYFQALYAPYEGSTTCGPDWEKISSSQTSHSIHTQQIGHYYLCAFNDAGTSSTVQFSVTNHLTSQ